VKQGTEIAVKTANTLETIVSGFDNVSRIVDEIASASAMQEDSFGKVVNSVTQISTITQSKLTVSKETAAASFELAGQSKNLIDLFTQFSKE
jgi:methyl-accepting chemotaxis protein